jgi:elongation factor 1-beta
VNTVESLQGSIDVISADLRDHNINNYHYYDNLLMDGDSMGKLVARIKILPNDVDVNLDDLANSISNAGGIVVKRYSKEPIAFGISALILDVVMDEDNVDTDAIEDRLRRFNGVGEVEIVNMSRESARL